MPRVKNIRHSGIVVKDLEQALWFYVQLLGFEVVIKERLDKEYAKILFAGEELDLTYVKLHLPQYKILQGASTLIELYYLNDAQILIPHALNHIALTVDNVEELYTIFQENKIFCLSKPIIDLICKHKLFFAMDPSDNLIEFVQEL